MALKPIWGLTEEHAKAGPWHSPAQAACRRL